MRFILFDKIVSLKRWVSCVGIKNVTIGEGYFLDHYSKAPIMPEALMIECVAQIGGWAITISSDYKYSTILAKIGKARFFTSVCPGDQLSILVEIVSSNDYGSIVKGTISVDGSVVAEIDNLSYAHHEVSESGKMESLDTYIFNSGGFLGSDGMPICSID